MNQTQIVIDSADH